MRDRLIEILKRLCTDDCKITHQCGYCDFGDLTVCPSAVADHLLASGVIVPPCKVGDAVYKPIITDNTKKPAIHTIVVTHIDVDINNHGVSPSSFVVGRLKNTHCGEAFDFDEIGKTVFLTKEEAEKALAERSGK